MDFATHLSSAGQFVEFLRVQVHEREIPGTSRIRAASACLALAQEHHHSIVLLVEHRLYGSAFALIRSAFEAYVRGEWLAYCALDAQVEAFIQGKEPPRLSSLIAAVEQKLEFLDANLSGIKAAHWSVLCAYTHSGGLHIQRWQTESAVEPSYADEEVLEMLKFAEIFGAVSAVALLGLANANEAIERVMQAFRKRTDA